MPILWIILAFLALLIWGNLSKKSACHPLNTVSTANVFTPTCSLKNTSGDNMASGSTFTAGVCEPVTPLTCGSGLLSGLCHPISVHFPVDPPPIAIQKPIITGTPIRLAPITPTPIAAPVAPKPIFPVAVGYHPAPVSTRIAVQSTNSVLLRQATFTKSQILGQEAQGVAAAQEAKLPTGSGPRPGTLAAYYASMNQQSQQIFDMAEIFSAGGSSSGSSHCAEANPSAGAAVDCAG
jgi:hypothetical protein